MTSVVEAGAAKPRSYGDLKPKRTEAMPKRTLFGSNLETVNGNEQRQLLKKDMKKFTEEEEREHRLKREKYRAKLPDHLAHKINGDAFEHCQEEVKKQREKATRAVKFVETLEEKARFFEVGTVPDKGKASRTVAPSYIQEFKAINGISADSGSRDLGVNYQPNINAGLRQQSDLKNVSYHRVTRAQNPDHKPQEYYMKTEIIDPNDKCIVKLPSNIKHKFGTKICQSVLSDPVKVEKTMSALGRRDRKLPTSSTQQALPALQVSESAYDALGAVLRMDIFPGHNHTYKASVTQSVFTDDPHKRRVPDPDQYRCQRDYLSAWAEQNVLRDRVKKAWDSYLEQAPAKT